MIIYAICIITCILIIGFYIYLFLKVYNSTGKYDAIPKKYKNSRFYIGEYNFKKDSIHDLREVIVVIISFVISVILVSVGDVVFGIFLTQTTDIVNNIYYSGIGWTILLMFVFTCPIFCLLKMLPTPFMISVSLLGCHEYRKRSVDIEQCLFFSIIVLIISLPLYFMCLNYYTYTSTEALYQNPFGKIQEEKILYNDISAIYVEIWQKDNSVTDFRLFVTDDEVTIYVDENTDLLKDLISRLNSENLTVKYVEKESHLDISFKVTDEDINKIIAEHKEKGSSDCIQWFFYDYLKMGM